MSFKKLSAARTQLLPSVQIGGETYYVKIFEAVAMEMAQLTGLANSIATTQYFPFEGDDAAFVLPENGTKTLTIFHEWQGYYRAKTVREAEIADNAAVLRNALTFAFQVVNAEGKRPWLDDPSDLSEIIALIEEIEVNKALFQQIGEHSGILKAVETATAEGAKTEKEVEDTGN